MSTASRRPLIAWPRISSASPLEYTSAESNMLSPASRQMSTRRVASRASVLPQALKSSPAPPKVPVPKLSTGTFRPEPPSCLYSIFIVYDEIHLLTCTRHADYERVARASLLKPRSSEERPSRISTAILLALLEGTALALLVPRLKRGRTSLHNDQKRLGALVFQRLGQDILQDAQSRPAWRHDLSAQREKLACRVKRRAA